MPSFLSLPEIALIAQGQAPANPTNPLGFLWPMLVIGLLFYLLMIRPERRRRAEVATMQDALKKNDRIVTIGGIIGVVVNVQKDSGTVTVRVDENTNTRVQILRSSISRVLTDNASPSDAGES
jgi:preprotein translocase subunit YajC